MKDKKAYYGIWTEVGSALDEPFKSAHNICMHKGVNVMSHPGRLVFFQGLHIKGCPQGMLQLYNSMSWP